MKGNRREIPAGIPIGAWWDKVAEYEGVAWVQAIPWYLPSMEYLSPDELRRTRAKAVVWLDITGEWPTDIDCWWEVRNARKRGDLPLSDEYVACTINSEGSLVCGRCSARWSPNLDGSDWDDQCGNLCGARWVKPEREEVRI